MGSLPGISSGTSIGRHACVSGTDGGCRFTTAFSADVADDASMSFLRAPENIRSLVTGFGFDEHAWNVVTEAASSATAPPAPPHAIQRLIMGDDRLAAVQAAGRRNIAEDRVATIHAVFTKR